MTSPFPPPPPSSGQWGNDGTGDTTGADDPPGSAPTSYDLYPADGGGWQDQPVTGPPGPQGPYPQQPAYPPQMPPPAYGPTSAPPYGPTSGPPMMMPQAYPPPIAPSSGNKGWIIGGVVVGGVVLVLVIGIVVFASLLGGDGDGDGGDSALPTTYTTTVPAAPTGGDFTIADDPCGMVDTSRFTSIMPIDGEPYESKSFYGDGTGYASCSWTLTSEDDYSYEWGTFDYSIEVTDSPSDRYISAKEYLSGSSIDVSGLGEKATGTLDTAYGADVSIVMQNGDLVLDLGFQVSYDEMEPEVLKGILIDTANELMNAMA